MTFTPTYLDYTAPDADTLPEAAAKINTNFDDISAEITAAEGGGFNYTKTALIGGGGTALDGIDGADLSGGEHALVVVGDNPAEIYLFVLDADSGLSESSPNVITPDDNPGTKAWILAGNCRRLHAGSAAPTADDDDTEGYRPLDVWEYGGDVWICADNTTATAVWLPIITSHTDLADIGSNTHAEIDTHLAASAPHGGHESVANKDSASGYAGLDASGYVTHEHGGLEDDVSAYDGLLKISGGSTSTVSVGTGSGDVAAGDDSRFVTDGDDHDHVGGDGAPVGLMAADAKGSGSFDLAQISTPANPDASRNKLYFKSDNNLYSLTSAGSESQIGGGGGTPASTVQAETSFGISSAVGTASNYAREDHTHGSPTNPVTGHESTYDHDGYDTHVAASAPHSGHEETANKDSASGYAGLDASGYVTHEHGGLEDDVSSYDGILKISGGSTSAVSVGTGSGDVAAGDRGVTNGDTHDHSGGDGNAVLGIGADAAGAGSFDLAQISTPANPSAGRNKLYFKSDGLLYKLSSGGSEQAIGTGTAASSVEDETTFGISSAVGSSSNYARQDHTHGSPTNPVTGHESTYDHDSYDTHLAASAPHSGHEDTANKDSASGYAGLDASGYVTHEHGGLEDDVSAYDGLLKISGGSTSAVSIGTGSGDVAAGDDGRFVTNGDSHNHSGGDGDPVAGLAADVAGAGALDLAQVATPANPASNRDKLYFKSDDKLYRLTSGGSEVEVTAPDPASSVEAETTFGISSAVGTATDYARSDHTHGSPTNPVTGHESTYDHDSYDTHLAATAPHSGHEDTANKDAASGYAGLDASGYVTHEHGGLEDDVSSYDGLLKITGGATSDVTVTTAGEALLDDADAGAQRTTLGLGDCATLDIGTGSGDVAAGDRGVTGGDGHDHFGGDGAPVAKVAADVQASGSADFAQIGTPANPSSGRNKLYFKSDGNLYKLSSGGSEAQIGGGGGTPATSVEAETSFGISSAVGTSSNYAREDHTHGSPTNPLTAHESTYDHDSYDAHTAASAPHSGHEDTANKGAASGYASLNASTLVPTAELGTGTPSGSTYLCGDQTWAVPPGAAIDYFKTALLGGGGSALDGIDGADLSGGERALVAVGDNPAIFYWYVLDPTSGLSESSPNAIEPDNNPGTKMWVLVGNTQRLHAGTASPTTDDDSTEGYRPLDAWAYNGTVWICADNSSGAAVWNEIIVSHTDLSDIGTNSHAEIDTHIGAAAPHSGHEDAANKGAASGYASLDSGTHVPTAELGSGSASSSTFLRGDQTWATPSGGTDALKLATLAFTQGTSSPASILSPDDNALIVRVAIDLSTAAGGSGAALTVGYSGDNDSDFESTDVDTETAAVYEVYSMRDVGTSPPDVNLYITVGGQTFGGTVLIYYQ